LSEDVVADGVEIEDTALMTPVPPLPLSQQVLAWALGALGYADASSMNLGVSSGTLKSARRGTVIARGWEDLVEIMLRLVRDAPEEKRSEARAILHAGLRTWDEMVGRMHAADKLSLEERLHVPLTLAIPQVGIRLGALVALVARRADQIEQWSWLLRPFDKTFFGKVVDELFRHQLKEIKTDAKRTLLEDKTDIHWRTFERWRSGQTPVPNVQSVVALGRMFGGGTEVLLRIARLAAVLGSDLREWIGEAAFGEWALAVAETGQRAARSLSSTDGVTALLQYVHAALEGPHGDRVYANLRILLPREEKERSCDELSARLAEAAAGGDAEEILDRPLARWAVLWTTFSIEPWRSLNAGSTPAADLVRLSGAIDLAYCIENLWGLRVLFHMIAEGRPSLTRPDGSPLDLPISVAAQDTARHWLKNSLRFRCAADEPLIDAEITFVLREVFGSELVTAWMHPSALQTGMHAVLDPELETVLPDEIVLANPRLCCARARRLAEAGNLRGALESLGHLSKLRPALGVVSDELIAALAAVAHANFDHMLPLRGALRANADGLDRDFVVKVLFEGARTSEIIVDRILQLCRAPEGAPAWLHPLVAAVSLAIRIMLLRVELGRADEGLGWEAVRQLVERLARCLEQQPTHGRGWAVIALWLSLYGEREEAVQARKQAEHFGAGDFFEREAERVDDDRGLSEDAG
jgi:hypothetical protein